MRNAMLALALGVLAIGSAACGSGGDDADATATRPAATATPPVTSITPAASATPGADETARPDPTYATKVEEAPIDDLELLIAESYPPQYFVKITSGLPSGCHVFDKAEITGRSERGDVTIRVTNLAPADPGVMCTAIYGTKETTVALGSVFTSGNAYTVHVNDRELQFTAQ